MSNKPTALPRQRTHSALRAPVGRPTANARVVTVGGIPQYLDRGHVAVELSLQEVGVAFHALSQISERSDLMAEMGFNNATYRQAFSRAVRKIAETVNAQVEPDAVRSLGA